MKKKLLLLLVFSFIFSLIFPSTSFADETRCSVTPTSLSGNNQDAGVNVTIETPNNEIKEEWIIQVIKDRTIINNQTHYFDTTATRTRTFTVAVPLRFGTDPYYLSVFVVDDDGDGSGNAYDHRCDLENVIGVNGATPGGEEPSGSNPCGAGTECPTALGNIPTDPTEFTGRILTIAIGLAGGIALIFMVFGSIKILTSAGDPKKVADGREIIIAAVAGTLFLILSVLILRFIGGIFLPTNPFS